jgi:hypothetical protein
MIYKLLDWEEKNVYELDTSEWVFEAKITTDERKQICKHNYKTMLEYISIHNPDIERKIQELLSDYDCKRQFDYWRTSYRYKCYTYWKTTKDVLKYVELCEKIYMLIRNSI